MSIAADLRQNEEREAQAFDALADSISSEALITSDWTFDRYRAATNQSPIFNSYPDLKFTILGKFLGIDGEKQDTKPLSGVKILDLGAGDGVWSVILAEQGADVSSVEISPGQVELAKKRMENHGLQWDARVGSAYSLADTFEADSFDIVFGPAILHHLTFDLPGVYEGVAHVLKDGGLAIFQEPYMGLKWLRSLRLSLSSLVPVDAESPDERPIAKDDIDPLREHMGEVELDFADVFAKFARRFSNSDKTLRFASAFDRSLLKLPLVSRLSSSVVITAVKGAG